MVLWFFRIPSMVYAGNIYAPNNKTRAKQVLREHLEVTRLPKGIEIWRS